MKENEKLLCGVSRRIITPPMELLPELNGLSNVVFHEVLDDIFVRVMVLGTQAEKLVFVVFDLDKVPYPEEYAKQISEQTGIPESNIAMLSIHTHTAPVTGCRPNEGPNFIQKKPEAVQLATRRYEAILQQTVLEAVGEALDSLRPARIGWGTGKSFVNVNRVQDYTVTAPDGSVSVHCGLGQNPAAPVDNTVFVLRVEDLDGKLIGCMINYAVHNCVMIGNRCGKDGTAVLSSDLGGNVSQYLEQANPGCVALWTSGAAGDVNPILSNEIFYPDVQTGEQTRYVLPAGEQAPIMMLKVLAARHYADVRKILDGIVCSTDTAAARAVVEWCTMPGKALPGEEKPQAYEIRVQQLRLGQLCWWGFSGELYSSLGKAIQDQMPSGTHVLFNHDASLAANSGYIFDDETLRRDIRRELPGQRSSAQLPGYVKDSLISTILDMWERSEGNRETQ